MKEFNPTFDLSPARILDHIVEKKSINQKHVPHDMLLMQLLEQIEQIDFKEIAFPQVASLKIQIEKERKKGQLTRDEEEKDPEIINLKSQIEKYKLNQKHFLIITVDEVLKTAVDNNWGMCKKDNSIYLYNGAYWSDVDRETLSKFLGDAAEKLGVYIYTAKYHKFKDELYKQFLDQSFLERPFNHPNRVCINLQNGTFEVTPTKQYLRGYSHQDFLTYQLPFSYDPLAEAPEFEKFLNEVLPVKEKQMILAEYLGYVFIKNGCDFLKIEQALFLYGGGANGKSVFFDIVSALLGRENISNYTLTSLTDEHGYQRAKIAGKLLNYASEISSKMGVNYFKAMVSGEPLQARLPYGDPFIMNEYAKLMFNCNELPRDVEHTNAFFRRLLIIHFDVTIEKKNQDNRLANRIIENELSGVFNWVLQGLRRIIKTRKFTYCEEVEKLLEQYKKESNTVALFIDEEGYKVDPDSYILFKDLYQSYSGFCYEGGYQRLQKGNFKRRLFDLKVPIERQNDGYRASLKKSV